MGKRSKVFLPAWMRWFIVPMLIVVWALITYLTFATPGGSDLGTIGWLIITLILVVVGVVMWLMTSGTLPAYVIEEEDQ